MDAGIGRVTLAVVFLLVAACCGAVAVLDWRSSNIPKVAAEPAADPEDVAAVIAWAMEQAGAEPSLDRDAVGGDGDDAATVPMPRRGPIPPGAIPVPADARAGGGSVSSIDGGSAGGGAGSTRRARNVFSRALNQPMAPPSSRKSRHR